MYRQPARSLLIILSLFFAAFSSSLAFAQLQVDSTLDPSQVERRFEERPQLPSEVPGPVIPAMPEKVPAPGMEAKKFELRGVNIQGSTIYTQEELKPIFADSLGKTISLADAQLLANAITQKYRRDGYILTQAIIPANAVENGILNIQVVEGFIDNVIIEGETGTGRETELLQSYANHLKLARPVHITNLERYLLLMDDLPGSTAKAIVRPSPGTFGAADLVINIQHKEIEGSLSADNRGNRFIGPWQYAGTLAANSVFDLYERTLFRVVTTTPMSELMFFDVQHEEQLGTEGTRLRLTGSHVTTEPGSTLKPLNIESDSSAFEIRVSHPFIRSRARNLTGRASFDFRNTDTDILGFDFTEDRLRVLRLGGEYDFPDPLRGVLQVDGEISQGLDILDSSDSGTARSRVDGESAFTKFNLDIIRTQPIFMPGVSLYTALSGQYSADKLLVSEQFAVGGPLFGGAYDAGEITGDHGVAARAELRYGDKPGLPYFDSYQLFTYYDIGAVWNKGSSANDNSLASTGVGVRANATEWLSGTAEIAFPLTRQVASEGDKEPRFFVGLTGRF